LLNAVSRLLLKQHCCGEIRCLLLNLIIVLVIRLIECWDLLDLLGQDLCNNVECSEVRLFRWWTCSGSNRLFLCWLWSIRCLFLRGTTVEFGTVIWVIEVIVRRLVSEWGHASPKTYVLMLSGIVNFHQSF
jgi:hypothetical protein